MKVTSRQQHGGPAEVMTAKRWRRKFFQVGGGDYAAPPAIKGRGIPRCAGPVSSPVQQDTRSSVSTDAPPVTNEWSTG